MPNDLNSVQMVIGAFFLLIGLLGGGLELSALRIPPVSVWVRLVSGAIGVLFLALVFMKPQVLIGPPIAPGGGESSPSPLSLQPTATRDKAPNATEISIIWAPEETVYLAPALADFNRSYAQGINPLTGQKLAAGERPIYVTGKEGSSGTVHQGIVNAIMAPESALVERPTIYAPSANFWLSLVNHQTNQPIFDRAASPPTALTPVVMAIWQSRLNAIQAQHPGQPIGWEELLQLVNDEQGWASYGLAGRKTVYYGHTDPFISSTGLATLVSEFYASARYYNHQSDIRTLSVATVDNPTVQEGVRRFEQAIKHYSERTTEFKEYIAQGPDYVDFVPLAENDLLYINLGQSEFTPPEPLVALYPKEGTFWQEHPFAIPNAEWVTAEQRNAAQVFTQYVLSEKVQRAVMTVGLMRPVLPSIPLDYPFTKAQGVDPLQPQTVLAMPDAETLTKIQASWAYVKKKADILLVIDTSGSMAEEDKLIHAQKAVTLFLQKLIDHNQAQNRVGLISFAATTTARVAMTTLEGNRAAITEQVNLLRPEGETALYDALVAAVQQMQDSEDDRIRAIIVLSDGQNTSNRYSLNDVLTLDRGEKNPILIFPVAYGSGADQAVLGNLARTFGTKLHWGDPSGIEALFQLFSSYF